ncbi:hypothetical protein HK098_002021 [Nowakowskiella sp. JEL0407]|nr:hypothetical protein HK098_002021 [Nowakowskiella sp. JEL0407]
MSEKSNQQIPTKPTELDKPIPSETKVVETSSTKSITGARKLSLTGHGLGPLRKPSVHPTNKILHILIPDVITDDAVVRSQDERATHNSEKEDYIVELSTLATDLFFQPVIHRLTISNFGEFISTIPKLELVLNLCDGSDIDGVPGPSVAEYLETNKFMNVIGCDSLFIKNTTTKVGMKKIFVDNLVACPPGFPVTKQTVTELQTNIESWGMVYPLFVKISDSYGSIGLDEGSVCHDFEQLQIKCLALLEKFENIVVEEYIDGPEFSVLISGNCRDPSQPVVVYPPAERAFGKEVPRFQRFITFLRNWDETLQQHHYAPVNDQNDVAALQDLARRAYIAVSGNCYGRVDIRKRDVSGKFYVLEVNASCGLGKGSSSDFILQLAGQTMKDFFQILLSSSLSTAPPALSAPSSPKISTIPENSIPQTDEPLTTTSLELKTLPLLHNPSLSLLPSPIVHVVLSPSIMDEANSIPTPEIRLSEFSLFAKQLEYVSEFENMFRNLGYDPIVHLYNVDDIQDKLEILPKDAVFFNGCIGDVGAEISQILKQFGFKNLIGLDLEFYKLAGAFMKGNSKNSVIQSARERRQILEKSKISIPREIFLYQAQNSLSQLNFPLLVYLATEKPQLAFSAEEFSAMTNSKLVVDLDDEAVEKSTNMANDDLDSSKILIEEYSGGQSYAVLVVGSSGTPNSSVLVFPPVYIPKVMPQSTSLTNGTTPANILQNIQSIFNHHLIGYKAMTNEIPKQVQIQDTARRAYFALKGSFMGIVVVDEVDESGERNFVVRNTQTGMEFLEGSIGSEVLKSLGVGPEWLVGWWIKNLEQN